MLASIDYTLLLCFLSLVIDSMPLIYRNLLSCLRKIHLFYNKGSDVIIQLKLVKLVFRRSLLANIIIIFLE